MSRSKSDGYYIKPIDALPRHSIRLLRGRQEAASVTASDERKSSQDAWKTSESLMGERYGGYEYLAFDSPHPRVLRITLTSPKAWNGVNVTMHTELARVWPEVDADPDISAVILTGYGKGFSVGGELGLTKAICDDFQAKARIWKETRDIAWGIINCGKPIVSAIRGPAYGGALAAALFCDISIVTPEARLMDGHILLGCAAGDGGALIWPLHCGMAKAKYYLLTCDALSGAEAERIGLVSLCVDDTELDARSLAVAMKLADGPPHAVRWTKHALNNWYRTAGPMLDASLALEFMSFPSPECDEGMLSLAERRAGQFAPASAL
jgi:enoyl-CoA hydratase